MGSAASTMDELSSRNILNKFIGTDEIGVNDPFWFEFLSEKNISFYESSFLNLDKPEQNVLRELRKNNLISHNIPNLVRFVISQATELHGVHSASANMNEKNLVLVQNGLTIIRLIVKNLLDNVSEYKFFNHFSVSSPEDPHSLSVLECLFPTLFRLIINIPIKENTYLIHCEMLLLCLLLLARQMYRELPAPLPAIYVSVVWGRCDGFLIALIPTFVHSPNGLIRSSLAPALIHRLMLNFAENKPIPPSLVGLEQSSFMWRAASSIAGGLLTIVTLGYVGRGKDNSMPVLAISGTTPPSVAKVDPVSGLVTSESNVKPNEPLNMIANLSSLLLLVLTTQAGSIEKSVSLYPESLKDSNPLGRNPFRTALFALQNHSQMNDKLDSENLSTKTIRKTQPGCAAPNGHLNVVDTNSVFIPIDFEAIRNTVSLSLGQDSTTLILYLLLHRNAQFRTFLMQDRNYEKLLLPILTILYRSPSDNCHLVYMALILLLIFTENEQFGRDIHTSKIKWVQWSSSRCLSDLSYGSLIIMVLSRTIQCHLNQLKDKYLHVNILAALANLSSRMSDLHPHASDKIVGLLQLLIKRHNKAVEIYRHSSDNSQSHLSSELTNSSEGGTFSNETVVQELSLLEEVIRMLLEIINSTLTHNLSNNTNLIYSLLYKKESFNPLRTHASFQNVMQNIDTILGFFSKKIELDLGPQPTQPDSVMHVISKHASNVLRSCTLKKFPDLKFKYVEEESPDEFFIPYVWSVVLRQSGIPFNADTLLLFASNPMKQTPNVNDGDHQQQNQSHEEKENGHVDEVVNQNPIPV